MRTIVSSLALVAGLAGSAAADQLALMGTAGYLVPREGVGEAVGGGAEARMVDDEATLGLSAIALVGRTPADRRRDVMDVRFDAGLVLCRRCKSLTPYVALGLDVLHVTTHEPTRSVRGSTLGLSGHAGLIGALGDGWTWRAGASYLGAIVPGTGEDLGGVTVSFGFGKVIID